MNIQRLLHTADPISTWIGKAAAWLIVALMLVVCVEVFKRYVLNAPTAWIFDVSNMLYGTLFMLCGAYTLAQDGHVRGDFLYGSMKPRTQAGWTWCCTSCSSFRASCADLGGLDLLQRLAGDPRTDLQRHAAPGLPVQVHHPLAGAIVLMQGIAEIIRCLSLHDRDYLSYLSRAEELTAVRLICLHNLTYMHELVSRARQAIVDGNLAVYSSAILAGAAPWDVTKAP